MALQRTYSSELKSWMGNFRSDAGLPKKPITLTVPEQKLIAQYEPKGGVPNLDKMRRAGKELAIASGTGMAVSGGVALLIGKTLLGGAMARVGVAGAFGAFPLGLLGPAILVGGTVAGAGYALYKIGQNKAQNDQAQAFGQDLIAHLRNFRPTAPPPSTVVVLNSSARRITVIYDPGLGVE